jgi:hypothetical protein
MKGKMLGLLAFVLVTASAVCAEDAPRGKGPFKINGAPDKITFSVSGDHELHYPASIRGLPDEHVAIMPARGKPGAYDFFAAMVNVIGKTWYGWTFVLRTFDLENFFFAPDFGDRNHGQAVFWPPHPFGDCNYSTVTHFDEQYAAPGSVLQDPTLPPGNLIMIYEAEIHCPPAPKGTVGGWVSVGVARSSDGGRSWPPPVPRPGFEDHWMEYGNGRYAGITVPGRPPKTEASPFHGDTLPSEFIDDMDPSGDYYIYVPYTFIEAFEGRPRTAPTIHIARAKLGDRHGGHVSDPLHFDKWYQGGWTQEGRGGLEDGIGAPCAPGTTQNHAQITYNDALQRYIMTFGCTTFACSGGKCDPSTLSLYYMTATSLAKQDWTPPQLIENSTYPYVPDPDPKALSRWRIDGGYASFMSPGHEPGHLGLTGTLFFLKGNPLGERRLTSRTFTIKPKVPLPSIGGRPSALADGGSVATEPKTSIRIQDPWK